MDGAIGGGSLTVLGDEETPQGQGEKGDGGHEASADGHAGDVIRSVTSWIQMHAHERSQLTDDVEHGYPGALLGIRILVVDGPGDDDGDGGEEADGGREDTRVAPGRAGVFRAGDGHGGISGRGQKGVKDDEEASGPIPVRELGGRQDDGKCDEVRRR